jgi:hypothetical protein
VKICGYIISCDETRRGLATIKVFAAWQGVCPEETPLFLSLREASHCTDVIN